MGPEVEAFEKEFAAYVGARHACAVSSCTTALHLALLGAGVGPGDEVITVSHTYIATANSVRFCQATPVFVDIDPDTFNMDPGADRARDYAADARHPLCASDRHALRHEGDPGGRTRHRLPVVEDAACAAGSEILWNGQWEKIGKPHGDVCCFSFHPRKLLTTGDGGMITTANAAWDERFRLLRHHGMSVSASARHQAKQVIFETYPETAFNYRMTDIQAAVGREQLKRLPEIIERRRRMAERYRERLAGIPGLKAPAEPAWARTNWQSYCVRLDEHLDQRQVMQELLDRGVAARRGIMCIHREEAYADLPRPWPLTESEKAQDHCVLLPLYHQMTEAGPGLRRGAVGERCLCNVCGLNAISPDGTADGSRRVSAVPSELVPL